MRARRRNGSPRRRRLFFEPLEKRRLLTLVTWDGEAGTLNWSDPLNWDTDALPGAADVVVIDVAGDITVRISGGDHSINSLDSQETLELSGGSLTLAAASETRGFVLGTATLAGTGDLTITSQFDWNGGTSTISGSGAINVLEGAELNISTPAAAPIRKYLDGRTLNNAGTATFLLGGGTSIYGHLTLLNGAVINNSGTFEVQEGEASTTATRAPQRPSTTAAPLPSPQGVFSTTWPSITRAAWTCRAAR